MTVAAKIERGAGATVMRDKPAVEIIEIAATEAGQRIDNFLIKRLKGVPKTRLYRALRSGEVRVNGARKKAPYQLQTGDQLRIPPLRRPAPGEAPWVPDSLLEKIPALFEDAHLLVVDKPAGLAAHGGSGVDYGVIEALRQLRADAPFLELVHRLDRDTSGCLMLAKSRAALVAMQAQWAGVGKEYAALVKGAWTGRDITVDRPLARPGRRTAGAEDAAGAGGRESAAGAVSGHGADKVGERNRSGGKEMPARSVFSPRQSWAGKLSPDGCAPSPDGGAPPPGGCALVTIRLLTGRMHQARRHAAAIARPIAGDRLYGDPAFNRRARAAGLNRLFLHAERLQFAHPINDTAVEIHAPLAGELNDVIEAL